MSNSYQTINFNCPCGFSFNQPGASMKKYEIVKRLHKKKCDKYIKTGKLTDSTHKWKDKKLSQHRNKVLHPEEENKAHEDKITIDSRGVVKKIISVTE